MGSQPKSKSKEFRKVITSFVEIQFMELKQCTQNYGLVLKKKYKWISLNKKMQDKALNKVLMLLVDIQPIKLYLEL